MRLKYIYINNINLKTKNDAITYTILKRIKKWNPVSISFEEGLYLLADWEKREEVSDPAKKIRGIGRTTYISTAKEQCKNTIIRNQNHI